MILENAVSFRKDLLFNGAVQTGWVEEDVRLANKAAEHFVFHGPSYHGVPRNSVADAEHRLVDTASFTHDIVTRLAGIRMMIHLCWQLLATERENPIWR